MKINTKDLRIAEVRYFDTEHNGVEIPPLTAYAFLLKVGEEYINIINPGKDYPVYERVPYSNTTREGWEFGTKIILATGECQDGLCYVVGNTPMEDVFCVSTVTRRELIENIVKSGEFFIDVAEIHEKQRHSIFDRYYREEKKKLKEFREYINSCEVESKQYCK